MSKIDEGDQELYKLEFTVDEHMPAYVFLRKFESKKSYLKLSDVTRIVLGVLLFPVSAKRAFSTAQYMTEMLKNWLSKESMKIRLLHLCE